MAGTPGKNNGKNLEDLDIIILKVEVNKQAPATPGDKEYSQIIKVKPESNFVSPISLWTEPADTQKPQSNTNKIFVISKKEKTVVDFSTWNGKEPITMVRLHHNDIVPSAGLPDNPKWKVIVNICDDKLPLEPSPSQEKNSLNAPENQNLSVSTPGQQSLPGTEELAQPCTEEVKVTETQNPQTNAGSPQKGDDEARVRVHVLLSFDTEKYTISTDGKWPKDIKQRKIEANNIYIALLNNDEETIKSYIFKRYIHTSRLPLDTIKEGEWLLPIFGICKSDSDTTKGFLAYVKIVIGWKSGADKPGDNQSQSKPSETESPVDKPGTDTTKSKKT
jgi:hypothetical protein